MNSTTKSILEDPLNYPIPETKEEKLKILHDLASQVLEGEPELPAGVSDLPGDGVDPAMNYILRFEAPFVIFACKIMYLRLRGRFSHNQQWVEFFNKQNKEPSPIQPENPRDHRRSVLDDNRKIAEELGKEFNLVK